MTSLKHEAWNTSFTVTGLDSVIGKVWNRLSNVLVLILEGNGSNNLVEKKRGKKFYNLDMPADFLRRRAPELPIAPNIGANDQPFYDLVLDEEESDDDSASI